MNNKILLTGLVLASLASTTMAAGLDNTVDSTAAHYGAEAYGYTNTITATGRSAFVTGYNNTVSANNALVYGVENKAEGINSLVGGEYAKATGRNSVAIGSHAEALKDNTFAIGSQARTAADNTVAIGNGAYAENENALAFGSSVNATGKNSIVIGMNAKAIANDSIALGANSIANINAGKDGYGSNNNISATWKSTASAVSIGDVANGVTRQITSVAAGTNDTDAVNVAQLKEVDNKINNIGNISIAQANHYADQQVNKGVAKASALAGLKFLDYNPKDKWSFAASVGHYRNANAIAVGAAYQPNENTMIHGGITVDGEVAYNLGVSFKTGGQKYINKYELAEQVKQLQSNNAELRQELNELRSMIEKK